MRFYFSFRFLTLFLSGREETAAEGADQLHNESLSSSSSMCNRRIHLPLSLACIGMAFLYNDSGFIWFHPFAEKRAHPLHELMIDGACMYIALGGLWFWLYIADIQVMTFSPMIVLLTAIHFHYSAFLSQSFMAY